MLKIDGKEVLEDGERLAIGVMLMDSTQKAISEKTVVTDTAGHKPGGLVLTDADKQKREQLYRDYETSLGARWKNPPSLPAHLTQPAAVKQPIAQPAPVDLTALYAKRDAALSNRWKGNKAA